MIAVFDNFLDQDLANEIKNDPTFFQDPGVYYYWAGPWNNEPTNTLKKRLIEKMWLTGSPLSIVYQVHGFEYWTGIQTANPELGFKDNLVLHRDKDESWFEKTGEFVTPMIGTVYYPEQEEFEGGMLEIYTNGPDAEPERVYAKPNRLIIFDAGGHFHRVTTVTKGTRKAFAVNLWAHEPYSKQIGELSVEQ